VQSLQQNITTLFDPKLKSQEDLFHFIERLIEGLPGRYGNILLLIKLGIPTSSAGLVLPRSLRERMTVHLHPDVSPGKDFIHHIRPREDDDMRSGSSGSVYQLRISELPVPQKHKVFDRIGV
jgi:hypothetical protein